MHCRYDAGHFVKLDVFCQWKNHTSYIINHLSYIGPDLNPIRPFSVKFSDINVRKLTKLL